MKGTGRLFVQIAAAIALLAFASDVVADNICRATGCAEVTSGAPHDESDDCGHCMCATHTGTVVLPPLNKAPVPRNDSASEVVIPDEYAPEALPVPIDHPPQLV